jgi:hypothetical protein
MGLPFPSGRSGRENLAFHVFVESDASPSLGQDHLKPGLAALQGIRSEIVAVQFDQIDWARFGRPGGGPDPPFLFTRYAMELMSCSDVYGFGRKR